MNQQLQLAGAADLIKLDPDLARELWDRSAELLGQKVR